MKLGTKLPLAFIAAMALLAAAALFGMQRLNSALDAYGTTVEHHAANEQAVADVLDAFKVQVQEWKNALLRGKDPAKLAKHWDAFEKQEKLVDELAAKLLARLPEGQSKTQIASFAQAHATMGAGYRKGYEAFKAAGFDSAAGDAAVAGVDRAPAKMLAEAGEKIRADRAAVAADAASGARRALIVSLTLMAVGCGVVLAASIVFSRSITRPLADAVKSTRAVADGDLASTVTERGRDEIGELLRSLVHMQRSLARVVVDVRQNSESVATASAQIATGNFDLSVRTEQQASALQQTAASMEQLSATVRQNSENAQQANRLAHRASEIATRGGETFGRVIETMRGINDSSREIVDIIGVIDSIAFQTNILALNAAVEAARAGDQGRGFAVVASEVRSLAQRSASAAKQIKALISASVERVEQGTTLVDETGGTMNEIVAAIRRVSEMVGEISAATSQQSKGIAQVGEAVAQMDQATQQNSALVEESAAAAESLKAQAGQLVHAVAIFRVDRQGVAVA